MANIKSKDYYSHIKFLYTRHESSIFVALKIPVTSFQSSLTVYQTTTYPVPLNHSTQHASQLLDLPSLFAISHDKQYFTTFSESQWNMCLGKHHRHCPFHYSLSPISYGSCATSLYLQLKEGIQKYCNFRFMHNEVRPKVEELMQGTILVSNISEIVLHCPKRTATIPGCQFCLLKIPCLCSVTSPGIYLPPRLDRCHNGSDITKLHPVNLALLQQFFDLASLRHISGDTLFENPQEVDIPSFHMYEHNMSSILANDQKQHLSLQRMAKSAQADQQIYENLAHSLAANNWNELEPSSWPLSTKVTSYLALALAALATAASIYLGIKLRSLTSMLLLMQNVRPVQMAQTGNLGLTYFTTLKPTISTNQYHLLSQEETYSHSVTACLIIISVSVIVFLIYKVGQKMQHQTKVCLELTTGTDCVIVDVMSLSLCPKMWHVQAEKSLQQIKVSGTLKGYLHITWNDLVFCNPSTKQEVKIPQCVPLNIVQAYKLRKILQQEYQAFLLFKHHEHAQYVTVCPSSCDGCHCVIV